MSRIKIAAPLLLALVTIGATIFYGVLPQRFDAGINVVIAHDPYPVSETARALHGSIVVADLHADTLLWLRDPAKRQTRGHVDLTRLREGGVGLQVFAAVTKTPKNQNYTDNDASSDSLTLLMIAQRWPLKTWSSLAERALYQAARLEQLEARADGAMYFVKTRAQLQAALQAGAIAGVFAIEGAHPLEGDLANLNRLFDVGLRVIGLQHFFDNELGGSLHGRSKVGLTQFGRDAVDAALAKGLIIDVAHSSEQVVRDVLARTDKPLIVSHTGVKGNCDSPRNISDALMQEIAAGGGLIGIGFWEGAICNATPQGIAGAIIYAVDLLGAEHVALGSDYDGAITAPFDVAELAVLTQALIDAGMSNEMIAMVMGGNAVTFFLENLPED